MLQLSRSSILEAHLAPRGRAIKTALMEQCGGRVFQTDTDLAEMSKHDQASDRSWKAFQQRASGSNLYFDYRIDPD